MPVSGIQSAPGVPISDDDLRFIGWVMTDGTISGSTRGIAISQSPHQPWNKDIVSCLKGCGFKYTKNRIDRISPYSGEPSPINVYTVSYGKPRGRDKHLTGWGRLENYLSKDFAPALEDMTREQLGVLLHAIHLGDGAKQANESWTRRSYHIATANRTFADRLQSLCVRRGYACNISETKNGPDSTILILHIKDITVRTIGTSRRDRPVPITEVDYKNERVWCVETKLGTLITRRNGKTMIMGNCQMTGRGTRPLPGVVDGDKTRDQRIAAIAASSKPHLTVLSFVGREGSMNLVGPEDVLAGEMEPPEVVERAKEILDQIDEDDDATDIMEAIEQAREQIETEQDQEAAIASVHIDGVEYEIQGTDWFDKNANFTKVLKSQTQLPEQYTVPFLEAAGYPSHEITRWDQDRRERASKYLQQREATGMCTLKQSNLIKRLYPNMSQADRKGLTKREAASLIGRGFENKKKKKVSA